jgi:hypothetical protein
VQLSYGHGWIVQDYRGVHLVQHGGLIDGFRVHFTLLPEHQAGFGILSNLHDTRMPLALSNLLVDYLLRLPPKDWNGYYTALVRADEKAKAKADREREQKRDTTVKPTLALGRYAGEYEHLSYGLCKIRHDDGRLFWEWSSFKHPLEPFRGDTFQVRDMHLSDPLVEFSVRNDKIEKLRMLEVEFSKK